MQERMAPHFTNRHTPAGKSDVFNISRAFADQVPRADRMLQIKSALDRGCYRVPTHVLTACLMFEMLQ